MITTLAEMQDRRRRLALDEDQLKTQKEQFAQTMGFNEKGQRQSTALKLLDSISRGGVDAHTAAPQLAQLLGFNPQEAQIFSQAAPDASSALQIFGLQQQKAGLQSMSQPQQQAAQQQAYLTNQAQTTPGQMAASNLQAQMLSTPLSAEMTRRVGEAAVMRQATGQDPFTFAIGQAGMDQGLAPAAAKIQAGIAPSWMNQAQDLYWRGTLMNDQNVAAARGAGQGMMEPGTIAALLAQANKISNDFAEGKYANKDLRDAMMDQYNVIASLVPGLRRMGSKDQKDQSTGLNPQPTGFIEQQTNKVTKGKNGPPLMDRVPNYVPNRYRPF